MATTPETPDQPLNIREQIVRIDKALSDIDRTRQEIRFAPFVIAFTGVGAGAAVFAAGAAFAKLFIN